MSFKILYDELYRLWPKYISPLIFSPLKLGISSIGLIIYFVAGIIIGTQCQLVIQGLFIVYWIWFFNTWECRQYEIGSLALVAGGIVFFVGLVIGDISYYLQAKPAIEFSIYNPFIVK